MIDSIAFVIPTYRTSATLPRLVEQITQVAPTMAKRYEIIVVDDACPERSGRSVSPHPFVRVVEFEVNSGQRTAVVVGMSLATADVVCVLDADLQDEPSSVPALVDRLGTVDVVCAGRRGAHESTVRRVQAWGFRALRWMATGRAVPRDAGLFHVAGRPAVEAMVAIAVPGDDPLVLYARNGLRIESVPTRRAKRPIGESGYVNAMRARLALASMRTIAGRSRHRAEWPDAHDVPRTEST